MPRSEQSVECPHCGCHYCPVLKVLYHKVRWRGKTTISTRRYRRCNNCSVNFTTVETYEDEDHLGFPLVKNPDPPKPPPPKKKNPYLREPPH